MTITYTWKVTSVKTKDDGDIKDAIVQVYWEKIGTDENGNKGTFSGATPFDLSSVDPEKFIPFNELSEGDVLSWVKSVVVGSYEAHVNEQIEKQLDQNKPKQKPLPWEPAVEPVVENIPAPTVSTSNTVTNIIIPEVPIPESNTEVVIPEESVVTSETNISSFIPE